MIQFSGPKRHASSACSLYLLSRRERWHGSICAWACPDAFCARISECRSCPGAAPATYVDGGLPVYRFPCDRRPRLELAYGVPDEIAAEGFRAIVGHTRPDIVHLHARTSAVSEKLVDIAHMAGARVVFTYHTPTVSCVRGTMMLFGKTPCDGLIETKRCIACAFVKSGVPKPLALVAAKIPDTVFAQAATITGRLLSAPRVTQSHRVRAAALPRFYRQGRSCGRGIGMGARCAPAQRGPHLQDHSVPPGNRRASASAAADGATQTNGAAEDRLFWPDRPAKGPDLLGRALKLIPKAPVQVDVFAIRQLGGPDQVYDWLAAYAGQDSRLSLRTAIAAGAVIGTMAEYDLIAVPSRWLETGPLVVLEAFAAGVPVLGANLGGIAELVRDGVDGVLVAVDDPTAWAAAIERLVEDRRAIDALRAHITPPRTMSAAAEDMAALYARILPR